MRGPNQVRARRVSAIVAMVACSFPNWVNAAYFGENDSRNLMQTGCNAATYAQLPGAINLFLGRQYFKADGSAVSRADKCEVKEAIDANRWGLVLDRLDWEAGIFTIVKPLLVPPVTLADGPLQGAILKAAYDPSVVVYHDQYLVSFECAFEKASQIQKHIVGTSSCMAVFDPGRQEIRKETIHVVISGVYKPNAVFHSASVPAPLVANERLYLYWSELEIVQGKASRIGVRGAELEDDARGLYWAKGAKGGIAYSVGPESVEIWGPDTGDMTRNTAVDLKSIWVSKSGIVALAGLGGSGCAGPGPQPGCFRMGIAKAEQPLGDHIFNHSALLDAEMLPTNPQGYTRPVMTPEGDYSFNGLFFKPAINGLSELRPVPRDWSKLGGAAEVLFPFPDKTLWPTSSLSATPASPSLRIE